MQQLTKSNDTAFPTKHSPWSNSFCSATTYFDAKKKPEKPGIFLNVCNAGPDQSFLITFSQYPPGNFMQARLVGSSTSAPALPSQPGTLPCWCNWEQAGYAALHLHSSSHSFAPKKKKKD